MQRKTPDDKCERLRSIDGTRLKRQCARFVKDHAAEIASASPEIPAVLNDRLADICEPLLVLADLARGPWPEAARQAIVGLSESAQANDPMEALLVDIQLIFTNLGVERAFSRTIVAALNGLTDRPWAETRKGKKINDQWLGRELQPYGIASETMRIGKALAKGYLAADFREALQRYFTRTQPTAGPEAHPAEARVLEGGGQATDADGQGTEDGGLKAEDRDQSSEDGGADETEKTEGRDQRSEGEEKKPDANDQRPETEGQKKDETGETPGSEAAAA